MDVQKDAYVIKMTTPVRHARMVFFGAIVLCALLVFNIVSLEEAPSWHQAGVRPFMGPLVYWSLAAAAHAFYILVRMACRLTRTVQDLFAVDRTRAVRLVTESESWARWWAPDDPA